MVRRTALLRRLARDEDGAALLEYGILVLFIAVVCIAAVQVLGSKINAGFTAANNAIP